MMKDKVSAREDANCQNNEAYQQIPSRVNFRFQFQPGLKYFM